MFGAPAMKGWKEKKRCCLFGEGKWWPFDILRSSASIHTYSRSNQSFSHRDFSPRPLPSHLSPICSTETCTRRHDSRAIPCEATSNIRKHALLDCQTELSRDNKLGKQTRGLVHGYVRSYRNCWQTIDQSDGQPSRNLGSPLPAKRAQIRIVEDKKYEKSVLNSTILLESSCNVLTLSTIRTARTLAMVLTSLICGSQIESRDELAWRIHACRLRVSRMLD